MRCSKLVWVLLLLLVPLLHVLQQDQQLNVHHWLLCCNLTACFRLHSSKSRTGSPSKQPGTSTASRHSTHLLHLQQQHTGQPCSRQLGLQQQQPCRHHHHQQQQHLNLLLVKPSLLPHGPQQQQVLAQAPWRSKTWWSWPCRSCAQHSRAF